jgi:8-oxo-dGTP pyrophosphatase MutT (NUDIX family)
VELSDGDLRYICSEETRCKDKIVAVLPYRRVGAYVEFLVRKEVTPCWTIDSDQTHFINAITGGNEGDLVQTVMLELEEEAGYDVPPDWIIKLGSIRGSKSNSATYYLHTVDLTLADKQETRPDSKLEALESTFWTSDLTNVDDTMIYSCLEKMRQNNIILPASDSCWRVP